MKKYVFTQSIGFKIEVCSRLLTNRLNKKLKQQDSWITAEQWGIINFLLQQDGLTQNQLAQKTSKDHTCVSRLIDNLIKRDLIERRPDESDRRTNLIYLTEAGKSLQIEIAKLVENHLQHAFHGIDSSDIKTCLSVIDRVMENLKEE
ncbi:MarR family winged helix-turn-helix transcriptional regulator [Pelosinus propionicus]|uniref:DNA-binding transcriptional regulator, MarR family n=1 Tax=Pelosinus propionicus DSM 13327 TaxID=1123291 RepID=A0A1I4MCV0_9FIRM|nr:MarR family winged helix-turn-helix transcriptional regulator [Pelosinus propionicus]SFM01202.1 DNA-binding transcriptional regulator, MarR family [Pelosinus propionicus DSM 13327]